MRLNVSLAVLLAIVAMPCYPQARDVLNFSLRPRSLVVPGSVVTIEMNGFPPGKEWLATVRVDAEPHGLLIANMSIEPRADIPSVRRITAVSEWPDEAVDIQPSVVKINTQSTQSNLFLYLEVTSGTRVLLRNNGAVLSDSVPAKGLMVLNGLPLPSEEFTFSRALAYFKNSKLSLPAGGISRLQNGLIVVNRETLRANSIATNLPSFPALVAQCKCVRRAAFELQVDASGAVKARALDGDADLVTAILPLLANWRFKPFMVDLQPTVVRSPITIRITQAGTAIW